MNEIGVVYATKTNHSQLYAEAIGKALNVKAENVANKPAKRPLDLLFIVGGIYGKKSMPELLEHVRSLNSQQIKQVVLITSNASKRQKQTEIRSILDEKGIQVLDELVCPGSFLFLRAGHPNTEDTRQAADFAVRISKCE